MLARLPGFRIVVTACLAPLAVGAWRRSTDGTVAPPVPVVVTGVVRDARTGQPLPHANVSLEGARPAVGAVTDPSGRYRFTASLTPGDRIRLLAARAGYQRMVRPARVTDSVVVDFALTPASGAPAPATVEVGRPTVRQDPASTGAAMDFSGKGVAGGIAGGVEAARAPRRSATTADAARRATGAFDREAYDRIEDNPFLSVRTDPRSTFSVDVDRAAYGNVRRFITSGAPVPPDAVRIEEMINYFPYALAEPLGADPLAITTEMAAAPWQPAHRLVRIAIQGRRIENDALPPSNLVFLIDVSGSMSSADKLPLVKESLRLLVTQLRPQDRVALVVYAGSAGLVLPSTSGAEQARIAGAIDRLEAGGSTAGGAGIRLAYQIARESYIAGGNNRVILATDGDFNVGASSDAEMERLIEAKRADGVYLTVLGFGTGNYQVAKMEKLAKTGNGNYAYVGDVLEARKTLVHEMGATLVTIANDVKLQVEFNPAYVRGYRLIGYEDRVLADRDFADDTKDAGDVGTGHAVTALYEIVPVGVEGTTTLRESDAMRYVAERVPESHRGELLFVKLRYKTPGDSTSRMMTQVVDARTPASPSMDFRFTAAVASFGMLLRRSEFRGSATAESVLALAREAIGDDVGGYRREFIEMVEQWERTRRVDAR